MKKRIITVFTACLLAGAMNMTAFAGQWQQNAAGWWYQNDDASYPDNGWNWVDGKCYYFDTNGYCLQNTTTPDGYTVDSNGAWIVDGVIQTQTTENQSDSNIIQIDQLPFTIPSGFTFYSSDEDGYYFISSDSNSFIGIMSDIIPEVSQNENLMDLYEETVLKIAMETVAGPPQDQSQVQLTSGKWYNFKYPNASSLGIPGALNVYGRINSGYVQIIMFAGAVSASEADIIMNTCIP